MQRRTRTDGSKAASSGSKGAGRTQQQRRRKKSSGAINSSAMVIIIFLFVGAVFVAGSFFFRSATPANPSSEQSSDVRRDLRPKEQLRKSSSKAKADDSATEHGGVPKQKLKQPTPKKAKTTNAKEPIKVKAPTRGQALSSSSSLSSSPAIPILPPFAPVENGEALVKDMLNGKPTLAGIVAYLQNFLRDFHDLQVQLAPTKPSPGEVLQEFNKLAKERLVPFDAQYRGRPIFPVREDGSIFLSLAAFREHLLYDTLKGAIQTAKNPDKIFVGAVVQNCFGKVLKDGTIDSTGLPCKTGFQVIGKNKNGRDMVKVSDAPPDENGIERFCNDPKFKKYCDAGQIRVLYIHESESLGPAMARYYASKLWGGENYFVQSDSHLEFAEEWDAKYIAEAKATKNFPKSVLSSYPPGFGTGGKNGAKIEIGTAHESPGARLCTCEFSTNDIEEHIIRINTGRGYRGDEPRPTQIPFIAAGFFFAHSNFLVDVPFDPFLPWCFMGEEIALSVRAWTSGWNIYAPRKNLIAHQYRPGRMGLPKFWESFDRMYHRPGMNNMIQKVVVQRVKNLVKYPESTTPILKGKDQDFVLEDLEYYSTGSSRTLEEYMKLTGIDVKTKSCPRIPWCGDGTME
mmetsp:Transcript_18790/g.27003  ORF Transcript_18790/g.27003 Transcript_18790/m.27003 type:complete len:626 (+) Transcript_18790:78-1955(+)